MHRSGTSAFTRIVNMMGVYIGSDDVLSKPSFDNPKGFWERQDVKDLNDRILMELGVVWDRISTFKLGLLSEEKKRCFESDAQKIIVDMDAHRPWGMKDPRQCLLFPLWRPLLENPVCVHVYRPPLEVALSLKKRNGIPIHVGVALWESYNRNALQASKGLLRILVHFQDLIRQPEKTAIRLFDALLKANVKGIHPPHETDINAFIDARLCHNCTEDVNQGDYLNLSQIKLVEAFENNNIFEYKNVGILSEGSQQILKDNQTYHTAIEDREKKLNNVTELNLNFKQKIKTQEEEIECATKLSTLQQYDIKQLRYWLDDTFRNLDDLFASRRWQIGDVAIRSLEMILYQKKMLTVRDHLHDNVKSYRLWKDKFDEFESESVFLTGGRKGITGNIQIEVETPLIKLAKNEQISSADIIVFPIVDWHFRIQRPQHLSMELAKLGHRVFYLSPSVKAAQAVPGYKVLESPVNNVYICQLQSTQEVTPSIYTEIISKSYKQDLSKALNNLQRHLELRHTIAIVDLPFWRPLAESLPGAQIIYDCMDYHAGFSTNSELMINEEEKLLREADMVVTTSAQLSKLIGEKVPNKLIRNGTEYNFFAKFPENPLHLSDKPVVGYVGAISEWYDIDLVIAAAMAYPEWEFILVGATVGCEIKYAEKIENIRFVGEVPYQDVATYVHAFDICLIPFKINELTRSTNPVKIYEYLSAGKPVVATALPELQLIAEQLHVADSENDFLEKLAVAMEESNDKILQKKRSAWAKQHDWSARATLLTSYFKDLYPQISVIILTYNNLAFTQNCIEGLEKHAGYPNWELIIVDNASEDGTIDFLQSYQISRSNVKLILNEENIGFAAGNNVGLEAAQGDYLIILNNDTYVTPGWMTDLTRHLRNNENLGLVGPVTNNIGNEAKIKISYSGMDEMCEKAFQYTASHTRQLLYSDRLAFFCVAMRRDVYKTVGALDENFGRGFFEDDDYCNRVHAAGYETAIAEDVFIHHHLSASFNQLDDFVRKELFEKNKAIYEQKWGKWVPHSYRENS
jgi:GT2 family glycosyltransferase